MCYTIKMEDLLKGKSEQEQIYRKVLDMPNFELKSFSYHRPQPKYGKYDEEKEKIEFDNIKPLVIDKPVKLFKYIDSWDKMERALKYIFGYDDNQCSSFIDKYYTKESREKLWN